MKETHSVNEQPIFLGLHASLSAQALQSIYPDQQPALHPWQAFMRVLKKCFKSA